MFERRKDKVLPRHLFLRRMTYNFLIGAGIIVISLLIGIWGYHYFEGLPYVDAYADAAMILSGMGPLHDLKTDAGKIFAGTYALFSGIIFLVVIAIIFAPIFHRFFHKFHIQDREKE
jgi:hypothetical protein